MVAETNWFHDSEYLGRCGPYTIPRGGNVFTLFSRGELRQYFKDHGVHGTVELMGSLYLDDGKEKSIQRTVRSDSIRHRKRAVENLRINVK